MTITVMIRRPQAAVQEQWANAGSCKQNNGRMWAGAPKTSIDGQA